MVPCSVNLFTDAQDMAAASHGAQTDPGLLLEWLHKLVSIRRRGRLEVVFLSTPSPEYHIDFQKAEPRPVGSSGMLLPVLLSHALGPIGGDFILDDSWPLYGSWHCSESLESCPTSH